MGYLQLGTVTQKGRILAIAIPPHLPLFKDSSHPLSLCRQPLLSCPASHSFAVYLINFYCLVLPQVNSFPACAIGFHPIIAPHLGHPI